MFRKIASLFRNDASNFTSLDFFHTTLPYMQGTFWDNDDPEYDTSSDDSITDGDDERPNKRLPSCGITSMSLAMQDDQGIEYEWLDRLSSIIEEAPELRHLELREWNETDHPALDQFSDEPRTWSATHLSLLDCGPLTYDVGHLLRKFRDLQSLRIESGPLPNSKYDGVDDHISIQGAIDSLASVKNNLVELEFDPGPSEQWRRRYQWPNTQSLETHLSVAFTDFPKLRRLQAPLEMFSQATDKVTRDDELHDFHTNFPPTLEELTLVVTCREPFHKVLEGAYALSGEQVALRDRIMNVCELNCETETYEKAHELFGELSRLAVHRDLVPALRELHLLRDPCQWLDCEHVKQDIRLLEEAGIAVHVRDREIEGPTQIKHKCMVSELY